MSEGPENESNMFNKTNKSLGVNLLQELKLPEGDSREFSRGPFQKHLPHHTSPLWFQGFIWRGVYLRVYSKIDGIKIKSEVKGLKCLAIEHLQTETSFKLNFQTIMKEKIKDNGFLDTNIKNDMSNAYKYINFLMPLICYVESLSWILVGTPIIYNKKHGNEELRVTEITNYFKKSLYLNNLTNDHLKFNFSNFEETSTLFQTPNSSATFVNPNNLNSIISDIRNIIPKHDPICVMYLINQDVNTNIVYFDTPE